LTIADLVDAEKFKKGLKEHQQGKTDYPTFIAICATSGIEKWTVDLDKLICVYYDKARNEILAEGIPQ
jgi:Phage envelope protein